MIKKIAEYWQILKLYRKIKTPYRRYMAAMALKLYTEEDTGMKEKLPSAFDRCDSLYEGFCLACQELRSVFPENEQEEHIKEMESLVIRDMANAYEGRK